MSANQPVFNRDRFLRQAPALFEERISSISNGSLASLPESSPSSRMLSPRSKRFLSGLVNTQQFHDLLERLDDEETMFFHQVMDSFQSEAAGSNMISNQAHVYGTQDQIQTSLQLSERLEEMEHMIPTYLVHRDGNRRRKNVHKETTFEDENAFNFDNDSYMTSFTSMLLRKASPHSKGSNKQQTVNDKNKMSLQELIELERKPWEYCNLFDIQTETVDEDGMETNNTIWELIQLKEALGVKKFRYVIAYSYI